MALEIKTPDFALVRFSDQHIDPPNYYDDQVDGSEVGYCIPVYAANELRFQFSVTGTEVEVDYICSLDPGGQICFGVVNGTPTAIVPALPGGLLQPWNMEDLFFQKFRVSDTEVVYVLQTPSDMFDFIPCDTCFQMVVYFELPPVIGQPTTYLGAISNCMKRVCDTAFTSLIEYTAPADTAGFRYCAGASISNKVRVDLYLGKPVFTEDSARYTDSKGAITITRMQVSKQYQVLTDMLPFWVHEGIRAAFVHKTITIQAGVYTGKIALNGSYDLAWPDNLFPAATGSCKVDVTPFLMRNNNCDDCETLAYELIADDYTVPGLSLPAHTYTVDLSDIVSSPCCTPVTYHIVSVNPTPVASASISGNTLTIITNSVVPGGVGYNAVVINATCGAGTSNNATIQMVF